MKREFEKGKQFLIKINNFDSSRAQKVQIWTNFDRKSDQNLTGAPGFCTLNHQNNLVRQHHFGANFTQKVNKNEHFD